MEPQIDEIEKEAKNMLLQGEHEQLLKDLKGTPVEQINKYFDTENFDIEKLDEEATLRVRNKKGVDVLEFKLPVGDDTQEYKTPLDTEMLDALFKFGVLPAGDVSAKLSQLGITGKFKYQGDLITYRAEVQSSVFPDAKIFLDESHFPNKNIDWEIEVESDDYDHSQEVLRQIRVVFLIAHRPSKRKIQRFRENLV